MFFLGRYTSPQRAGASDDDSGSWPWARLTVEREAEILLRENSNDLWALPNSEETVGRGYALLGDADQAMPHIERAVTMPSQFRLTPAYLRLDVVWDKIRKDPRFQKLAMAGK